MLFLLALTFLEAFNPRGGGLKAGLAALLFTAVPLLWFFAGRELATDARCECSSSRLSVSACLIARTAWTRPGTACPPGTAVGERRRGTRPYVGTVIRAFGTFSSAAEYASFLGIAIVAAVAFAVDRRPYLLPAVPLLAMALFYESSRGIVVTTVVACSPSSPRGPEACAARRLTLVVLLAGRRPRTRARARRSSGRGLLVEPAGRPPGGWSRPPAELRSNRRFRHISRSSRAVLSAACSTRSDGIGSTTLAGSKYGTPQVGSTEVDLSNQFVADGFGGLAYLAIVFWCSPRRSGRPSPARRGLADDPRHARHAPRPVAERRVTRRSRR